MSQAGKRQQESVRAEQARRSLRQAERGDTTSAERLRQQEHANPEASEAVEQEASEGPDQRGLSR